MDRRRDPKGIPSGGEFATGGKAEPDIELGAAGIEHLADQVRETSKDTGSSWATYQAQAASAHYLAALVAQDGDADQIYLRVRADGVTTSAGYRERGAEGGWEHASGRVQDWSDETATLALANLSEAGHGPSAEWASRTTDERFGDDIVVIDTTMLVMENFIVTEPQTRPSMQTDAPLEQTTMNVVGRPAQEYQIMRDNGMLELDAPYQRGSVWTTDQQRNLVRSWLQGIPIPAVIVNDRLAANETLASGDPDWRTAVIDGKQRVETAIAWFDSDLSVPASWFPPDRVEATEDTDDGPYVRFSGLTVVGQRFSTGRFMLPTAQARLKSVAEEAEVFGLVNTGGTPQTEETLANARAVEAR